MTAPRRRRVEPAGEREQGRLAGAGRPHDGDELAGGDREGDAAQGVHGRVAVPWTRVTSRSWRTVLIGDAPAAVSGVVVRRSARTV